jgi:hypothetical protein
MTERNWSDILPAMASEGRLEARDAEILARYWDERHSEDDNLRAIGYWLDLREQVHAPRCRSAD